MADFSDKDIFFQRLKAQGYTVETLAKIMAEQMPSGTFNPSGSGGGGAVNNTILQNGSIYPTATADQLALPFLFYQGYNYPTNKRVNDEWLQTPAPVVQTDVTDQSATEFRVNWNAPLYLDYEGNIVNAPIFEGYVVEISDDDFATSTEVFTQNTSYLFTGLAQTEWKTRVFVVDRPQGKKSPASNVITTDLTAASLYDSLVALSPLYALDFRTSEIADTSVSNAGSLGGTLAKSGTFTKNVGLVGQGGTGTRGTVGTTFSSINIGEGGVDWYMLFKVRVPATDIQHPIMSVYSTTTSRVWFRGGGIVNNGRIAIKGDNVSAAWNIVQNVGNTVANGTARVMLAIKIGATISIYEAGSTTATDTVTIPTGALVPSDELRFFGNDEFGTNPRSIEIEYAAFHQQASIDSTLETNLRNLMLLAV